MTQHRSARMRRFGVLVAVPTISALTLAACGGGDDNGSGDSGGSGGSTEAADSFTFAFGNASGSQESPWLAAAEKYSEETGVQVETEGLPPDSYGLTLRTQVQGGNAPDVFVVSPGAGQESAVLPLAEAGYVEPLGDEAAALIPEGSEGLFSIDGEVYAQPTDLIPVGMLWNVGAAAEAGIDLPADTDAMLEACEALSGDSKSFVALAGSVPPNPGLMTMAISATRVYADDPDWNAQRAAGDVTFADSEGWQDTLQTVVDMNEAGCFQPGAAGAGFDAITQGITQGTALTAYVPGGAATELMNATEGLELNIQAFPPASGGEEYILASPNYALAVSAEADDATKQAAMDFLAWLAEPENAAEFVEVSGGVAITGPDENISSVYEPVAGLLDSGSYAPLPNLEWPNPGIYDALATGVQGLIAGQGDVQTVLESVDRAWGE
jgi:raffinose/stachyose/melibiose transport system substrate-binding protein